MRYKAIENVLSNAVTSYQDHSGSLECVGARFEADQLESFYGYPGTGCGVGGEWGKMVAMRRKEVVVVWVYFKCRTNRISW